MDMLIGVAIGIAVGHYVPAIWNWVSNQFKETGL